LHRANHAIGTARWKAKLARGSAPFYSTRVRRGTDACTARKGRPPLGARADDALASGAEVKLNPAKAE